MSAADPMNSLVTDWCRKFGLDADEHREGKLFVFGLPDGSMIMMSLDEEELTVFAEVGSAPQGDPEFLEELLEANLFWTETDGCTLALDRTSRAVVLSRSLGPSSLADFERAVDAFIVTAAEWRETLTRLTAGDDAATGRVDRDRALFA
jgi:hypothetical protein